MLLFYYNSKVETKYTSLGYFSVFHLHSRKTPNKLQLDFGIERMANSRIKMA